MAYPKIKEEDLLELARNDRGDYINVKKCETANGDISFDIRQAFTNDEGEVIPLKKGVRIKDTEIAEILGCILANMTDAAVEEVLDKVKEYKAKPEDEQAYD